MKIVAIADHVIVKEDKKEEMTAGGIVLPDNYWREKIIGTVIAVGPGPRRNGGGEMQCKVGDKVLFKKTVFFPFSIIEDGKEQEYFSVQEQDVVCILED